MSLDQKSPRVFGVLFLITFVTSIPALALYQPVLDHPVGYIAGTAVMFAGDDPSNRLRSLQGLATILRATLPRTARGRHRLSHQPRVGAGGSRFGRGGGRPAAE